MDRNIEFPKTEPLDRLLAKFIDFLILGALFVFPSFIGPLAALTYILISDGLKGGQSPGKKIVRLKVISIERDGDACNFKESILRNIPYGLIILFSMIPYLRWVLMFTLGLIIIVMEVLTIYGDEKGVRWGDNIAGTMVVPL
ncbi:MAG: RDD family protein [Thermodesulfobacteriota bacterium]